MWHSWGARLALPRCHSVTALVPDWHCGSIAHAGSKLDRVCSVPGIVWGHGTVSASLALTVSVHVDGVDLHRPDPFVGGAEPMFGAFDQPGLLGLVDRAEHRAAAEIKEHRHVVLRHDAIGKPVIAG